MSHIGKWSWLWYRSDSLQAVDQRLNSQWAITRALLKRLSKTNKTNTGAGTMIKVLVVDDTSCSRHCRLLADEPTIEIIGEASSGEETSRPCRLQPDLVLMDVNIPGIEVEGPDAPSSGRISRSSLTMRRARASVTVYEHWISDQGHFDVNEMTEPSSALMGQRYLTDEAQRLRYSLLRTIRNARLRSYPVVRCRSR